MGKQQILNKISEWEKIKSKSVKQEEIEYCDEKIAELNQELVLLEKPVKPEKKQKSKKTVEFDNSIDYDFDKGANKHLVKAKKTKRSIVEEFGDIF